MQSTRGNSAAVLILYGFWHSLLLSKERDMFCPMSGCRGFKTVNDSIRSLCIANPQFYLKLLQKRTSIEQRPLSDYCKAPCRLRLPLLFLRKDIDAYIYAKGEHDRCCKDEIHGTLRNPVSEEIQVAVNAVTDGFNDLVWEALVAHFLEDASQGVIAQK